MGWRGNGGGAGELPWSRSSASIIARASRVGDGWAGDGRSPARPEASSPTTAANDSPTVALRMFMEALDVQGR